MTLPNLDGLAPGEITELYSFDHDMGRFISIGTASVSADGTVIVPDPGVGIRKGGWQCGGNPARRGDGENVNVTIAGPDRVDRDDTVTLVASGSPGSGFYEWSTNKPDIVTFESPTSGLQRISVVVRGLKSNEAQISATFTSDDTGKTAEDSTRLAVLTKDITVISWLDPEPVRQVLNALTPGTNPILRARLNTPGRCSEQLGFWTVGRRFFEILTETDILYANAFLLTNSPNEPPPSTIDPDAEFADGDWRLFNRFKILIHDVSGPVDFVPIENSIGTGLTPPPCPLARLLTPEFVTTSEPHPLHGADGRGPSGSFYQLVEGRVGLLGQTVDLTLNDCGIPVPVIVGGVAAFQCSNWPLLVGRTTPWIFSVVRLDVDGNLFPIGVDHSLFPSRSIYIDGELVLHVEQSNPFPFIDLDRDNSARLPGDIP